MENDANPDEANATLLSDLLPTYQKLAASLNRVRRMMWAWDYARARDTVTELNEEYQEQLETAREILRTLENATRRTISASRSADQDRSEEDPDQDRPSLDSDYHKLLDARTNPLPAENVPSFLLGSLAIELHRLTTRLEPVGDANDEETPAASEVGGFRYLFTSRSGLRLKMRGYRDHAMELATDTALDRLRAISNSASLIDEDQTESVQAFRLVLESALLDFRIISGESIQGVLYPFRNEDQPAPYFDQVIEALTTPEQSDTSA